jgi:hypothetical protein
MVVKAVRVQGTQWSSYGHIVEDVRIVLNSIRSWTIGHVKRYANFVAHMLAKEAVKGVVDHIWMEEIPLCIFDIVILEQNALSNYSVSICYCFD